MSEFGVLTETEYRAKQKELIAKLSAITLEYQNQREEKNREEIFTTLIKTANELIALTKQYEIQSHKLEELFIQSHHEAYIHDEEMEL